MQLPSITSQFLPMYIGPLVTLRNAPSTLAPSSMNIFGVPSSKVGVPITMLVSLRGCEVCPVVK